MKQNLFSLWINLPAPHYSIIKKRLNIWDKDLKLCGSIDMLYEHPDGKLSIYRVLIPDMLSFRFFTI